MATPTENLQEVQGAPIEIGEKDDTIKNGANTSVEEFKINVDKLRKFFHESLDINRPVEPKLNDQSCVSMESQVNSQVETAPKETKKRSITEVMSDYETCLGLDLELKLSPPGSGSGSGSKNLLMKSSPLPISISSSSSTSASSSHGACVSSNLESVEKTSGTSNVAMKSLVVMGCTMCYLYVMVLKSDPICPKCKNPALLDIAAQNPAKKLRRSKL